MFKLFGCFLLVVLAAACSSSKNSLKPNELVKFEPEYKIKNGWNKEAGKAQKKKLYARFMPAIVENTIYVGDHSGQVFAYAINDYILNDDVSADSTSKNKPKKIRAGQKLWTASTERRISAAIAADKSSVYLGSEEGELIALDASTGSVRWTNFLSSEITGIPATNGEKVVATSIDGGVFTFDVETGKKLWDYRHPVPSLTYRSTASPILTTTDVVVAFDSGQLKSMSLEDGTTSWEMRVSRPKGRTDLERVIDIDGTPILDGGTIYAATVQGAVVAVDRGNGRIQWRQDFSTSDNLALGHGNLYGVTPTSELVAFDAYSGAVKWKNEQLLRRSVEAPVVFGDFVVALDGFGYIHFLDSEDGRFVARKEVASSGFGSRLLAYDDEILYVLDRGGNLKSVALKQLKKSIVATDTSTDIDSDENSDDSDISSGIELSLDGLIGDDNTSPLLFESNEDDAEPTDSSNSE